MHDTEQSQGSFIDRARSAISNIEQDDGIKQATAATKEAVARTQDASKGLSRKVTQEDSWDELRGAVEELTEIARAHHALITDLIDRVAALEDSAGTGPTARH